MPLSLIAEANSKRGASAARKFRQNCKKNYGKYVCVIFPMTILTLALTLSALTMKCKCCSVSRSTKIMIV